MSAPLLSLGTLTRSLRSPQQSPVNQTCQYCAKRLASSKARSKRQPSLEIELLRSVPKVGNAGQRVTVAPGFMRNHLYPKRLAMYVVRGRALGLDGTLQAPKPSAEAASSSPYSDLASQSFTPSQLSKQRENAAILELSQAKVAEELNRLPTIVFTRRTAGATALHGSVSTQDLLTRLQEMGVQLTALDGQWVSDSKDASVEKGRAKSVGQYEFRVKLQKMTVPLQVQVIAEQADAA